MCVSWAEHEQDPAVVELVQCLEKKDLYFPLYLSSGP